MTSVVSSSYFARCRPLAALLRLGESGTVRGAMTNVLMYDALSRAWQPGSRRREPAVESQARCLAAWTNR